MEVQVSRVQSLGQPLYVLAFRPHSFVAFASAVAGLRDRARTLGPDYGTAAIAAVANAIDRFFAASAGWPDPLPVVRTGPGGAYIRDWPDTRAPDPDLTAELIGGDPAAAIAEAASQANRRSAVRTATVRERPSEPRPSGSGQPAVPVEATVS